MPRALDHIDSTRAIRVADRPIVMERYQIEGLLGFGGVGDVFKAFHINLKRDVAIKTLRVDFQKDPGVADRFLREMETIGQVDHPNVVRASDAGESNGILMLVMELLSGLDLSKIGAKQGRLKPSDACELIRQSAEGLAHIHHTMIHRDIKPSNLMLTKSGVVKILDLGLARFQQPMVGNEITPSGFIVGTFDYMAPEQAQGDVEVDQRADIYSLGCTLFRLLAGQAPFAGKKYDSAPRKMMAHKQIPIQDAERFDLIPAELQPILLRMLAKNAEDRYASADEVAAALAPHCKGHDITALIDPNFELSSVAELTPKHLEELKRLGGQSQIETSRIPTEAPKSASVVVSRRFAWLIGMIGTIIAGLLVIIAVAVLPGKNTPTTTEPKAETTKPGSVAPVVPISPRDLDGLGKDKWHNLMTDQPFSHTDIPIGASRWVWDPKEPLINIVSRDLHILSLGTTSHRRVQMEVRFNQVQWTGNVGVFWGYTEDSDIKNAKKPLKTYATMQCLMLKINSKDPKDTSIVRMEIEFAHNKEGEFIPIRSGVHKHQLSTQLGPGTNVFTIDVIGDKLIGAKFGAESLTNILIQEAQPMANWQSNSRSFGIIADSHLATVDLAQIKY